jgi:hypothetical protein
MISLVFPINALRRADISSARSRETPQLLMGNPSGLMNSAAWHCSHIVAHPGGISRWLLSAMEASNSKKGLS